MEFAISEHVLGEGAFRKAYKASSSDQDFKEQIWVVKKYKDVALETIAQTNQSVEQHTRKVIQMHCLAQNFACQLAAKVIEEGVQKEFGNTIVYEYISWQEGRRIFYH